MGYQRLPKCSSSYPLVPPHSLIPPYLSVSLLPTPSGEESATAFKRPSVNHQPNKGAQLPFEIQIDDINNNEAPPCISPSYTQYFNRPCVQRRVPAVGLRGKVGGGGGLTVTSAKSWRENVFSDLTSLVFAPLSKGSWWLNNAHYYHYCYHNHHYNYHYYYCTVKH